MSLRLLKLFSEPPAFDSIVFRNGVNLILGESSPKGTQAKKVNGVGKSVLVDFLHFALCRDFKDTRVSLIPLGVLPDDLTVILDLAIHGNNYQIRRRIATPEQVTLINHSDASIRIFTRIEEATRYLGDKLFDGDPLATQTSFRQLLSLLMRDEKSGFRNPLNPMSADKRAVPPLQPHLYLMGIRYDTIHRYEVLKREMKSLTASINHLEKILTENRTLKMADIPAKLNKERERVKTIEAALAQLKTDPAFKAIESKLIDIESQLLKLRSERKRLAWQIEQIRIVPQNERVDTTDMKIVYDRISAGLGDLVRKSLEQAMSFKAEIEQFQQSLIKEELGILETTHRDVQHQISRLSDTHHELTRQIDNREVLSELRNGLTAASKQSETYHMLSSQYQMRERQIREKSDLKLQLETQLREVRILLEEHRVIANAIEDRIIALHQRIMSSAEASFKLVTAGNTSSDRPCEILIRIKDDRSKSIDEAKVLIYDFALLTAPLSPPRHPGFLLHDNILDVDNDTLVQSLNFIGELEDSATDFQYILTLNRDKIEPTEIARDITLDIPHHTIAKLTKSRPFLWKTYQEL